MTLNFNNIVFSDYSSFIFHISEKLRNMTQNVTINNTDIIKLLQSINKFMLNDRTPELYEEIINSNFHNLYINLLKQFNSNEMLEIYRAILSGMIIMTDISKLICETFVKVHFPNILINETLKVCREEFQSSLPKSVTLEEVVAQLISIIHNIARHSEFQESFIQNEKAKSLKANLRQYLKSKDKRMIILTMSVLTWLAEDDGKDYILLEMHSNCIKNFIDYINKGMKDNKRRFEGWEVSELLAVLSSLACMGSIKHEAFLTPACINSLITIFKSKTALSTEMKYSLDILWNLSFTDNYKSRLNKEYKIKSVIEELVYSNNETISNSALSFIKDLSEEPQTEHQKTKTIYDIFVSYCHAQNKVVKRLVIELKKKFTVWVDTEGIKGCGMSDMAKGIEDSKVLLMGVSNSYKQSAYCRSEANWAFRLKKPIIPLMMEYKYKPDGWLGMIISPETYIQLSSIKDIEKSVKEIEEHINHKC